jgi:DsbC/DsbD-like thiol-disulfide interchange protein
VSWRGQLGVGLMAFCCAPASLAAPPNPVHWSVRNVPAKVVNPGGKFAVALDAQIDAGWHIYTMDEPDGGPISTQVGLADTDPVRLLSVDESTPQMMADPGSHQPVGVFTGSAGFTLHLQMPTSPLAKGTVLHMQIRYQSCSDRVCLPPRTVAVPVALAPMLR